MTIDRKCLINWVGGKRLLRKTIAPLIPKDIKSYTSFGYESKNDELYCIKNPMSQCDSSEDILWFGS